MGTLAMAGLILGFSPLIWNDDQARLKKRNMGGVWNFVFFCIVMNLSTWVHDDKNVCHYLGSLSGLPSKSVENEFHLFPAGWCLALDLNELV